MDHIPEELDKHLLAVAQVLETIETKQKSEDAAAKAAASTKASEDADADPLPKVGEKAEDDDDLAHVAQPVPGDDDDEAMEAARKRAADAPQISQEGIAKADLDSEEASKKLKLSATAAVPSAGKGSGARSSRG
jgi:hypothetical protein